MKKHICYTGARLVDRRKTGQTNEIQINENADAGHLFALTGIDMNEYAHPNSWGEYWGDKGFFYTPFDKAKWLYSIVALIDKTNATPEVIEDTKDNEEIVKRGIRNGKLPDADLVKLHAVYMVMRAFFDQFDNDKAIAEALKKRIVRDVH